MNHLSRNIIPNRIGRWALAASLLACTAQADVILNPPGGPIVPTATPPISVGLSTLATTQVTNGEVTGPKMSGEADFSSPNLGLTVAGALYNIQIDTGGTVTGTFQNDSVPVSWDFTLAEGDIGGDSSLFWTLTYSLTARSVCSLAFTACTATANPTFQTSGSGFDHFSGTGSITGITGFSASSWSIDLDINWQPTGTSEKPYTLSVIVPGNSIDFPATSVPEAGTAGLLTAGLAGLALLRRYRRQ